ncbi:hypothetical protein R3O67_29460 [Bacillus cereus]|uniref:hypothetical protein n=1 Tax=Bacillus cereus TaxID=1396 RepID=UPI00307A9A41
MLTCQKCNKGIQSGDLIVYVRDVDFSTLDGEYCQEHAETVENELKKNRLVETYKGIGIYRKDDTYGNVRYYPNWQSLVHYKELQWARDYINRELNKN